MSREKLELTYDELKILVEDLGERHGALEAILERMEEREIESLVVAGKKGANGAVSNLTTLVNSCRTELGIV